MKPAILDLEICPNYFLAMFKNLETGAVRSFELMPGGVFDAVGVRRILSTYTLITFNGNNFDTPLLALALKGADNEGLFECCEAIIKRNMKPWEVEREFNINIPKINHIDIMEVAPGQVGLKLYGARLGVRDLENLPIEPGTVLTQEQMERVKKYCEKDLANTETLYRKLLPQIKLRAGLGDQYKLDLRSKSDAQIAEAVIKSELEKVGVQPVKPGFESGQVFKYDPPSYVGFHSQELKQLLRDVEAADFIVSNSGKVLDPPALKQKVTIGNMTYKLGIGGLHSTESGVSYYSSKDNIIIDRDVASYYPALILNNRLYPEHLTKAFLTVYKSIVDRRLKAKRAKNSVVADCLKIVINGSFGKFGSPYSILYAPKLLIQTTVTGQLSLLMLIEWLELEHIPVISANTDGIVINCPAKKTERLDEILHDWELETGLETEETRYSSYHARDVNNYVAIKADGYNYKSKGIFTPAGLAKNPDMQVCSEAVINHLMMGLDLETLIKSEPDFKKFLCVRSVTGGAVWKDELLGKVVRWYYSTNSRGDTINYKVNGNKVPKSEGGKPVMLLPDKKPDDIDYDVYIDYAKKLLKGLNCA